mmetsp:Transcript_20759/g.18917  ORF Transcript_20759/g.18917 Transcript_20759/m.18917 type:complete len:666 (+) Transcript_20759:237-2234(+)
MGFGQSKQSNDENNNTDLDKNHPDNKKLIHEGWTDIKDKKRGCTDLLFMLLLILTWIAMTIVGFIACGIIESTIIPVGNPKRLVYATDYKGAICGVDESVRNKPKAYYLLNGQVVCIKSCPDTNNVKSYYCKYPYQSAADNSTKTAASYVQDNYCIFKYKTSSVLNRCIPNVAVSYINSVLQDDYNVTTSYTSPSTTGGWFNDFLSDVYKYSGIVFGFGLGVSTFVAFMYLYLLRIPGLLTVSIWTLLISFQILLLVGSFLLWSLSDSWNNDGQHTTYEVTTMQIFAFTGMGISLLYFCLLLVIRKRIQLAIGIVKESTKAINSMPILIFFPILQVIGITMFLVPWFIYVLFLASSGDKIRHTSSYLSSSGATIQYSYYTYSYTTNTKYVFLFLIFCYYWTSEFIIALGQGVLSLSIVSWYFNKNKSSVNNGNVIWAFKTMSFYHIGSFALGSLIIGIIKTIRAVLTYIAYHAKKSKNKILEYFVCVIQCLLYCVEKFMKFINKNAYIQTAIYGYSFCKSARVAFFLILRNIIRIAAVNIVADFVLLLGKLFIPGLTVFICYLVMAYSISSDDINGIIAPLVFVGLLSYFIALMFSEVFSMTIETILNCYIADEEMFSPADRFADGSLQTTLQKTAQQAAAIKAIKIHPQADNIVMLDEKGNSII